MLLIISTILLFVAEIIFPRRPLDQSKWMRLRVNGGLAVVSRLLLMVAPIAPQMLVEHFSPWSHPLRILWQELSSPLQYLLAIVILDFAIFWQHVFFHKIPWLWRLHEVHHSDKALDMSSGVRFHPLEIGLSYLYKSLLIIMLAMPLQLYLAYSSVLLVMSLFSHANLNLPIKIDKLIRYFVVSPDMHRIHHSIDPSEHNSNFGNFLSIWDKLFSYYISEPKLGQIKFKLGTTTIESLNFFGLLLDPFKKKLKTH